MLEILTGDALELLRTLPNNSVDCCITSPPFYGLRDYQLTPSIWGGDPACEHEWGAAMRTPWANAVSGPNGRQKNSAAGRSRPKETGPFCAHCGAWKGCLGLEPDPEDYIAHLTEVFAAVWRVLKPTGICWVEIGDSYARSASKGQHRPGDNGKQAHIYDRGGGRASATVDLAAAGLKEKSLILIPQRLAIALQQSGWIIRNECIWAKGNPCPESVKDRLTRSHSTIWLLTKEPRYYWDREAILEPFTSDLKERYPARAKATGRGTQAATTAAIGSPQQDKSGGFPTTAAGRNKRSVWSVNVRPGPKGHHATFPPELVRPMILAGCPASGIVLDPFAGAGTTLLVAQQLGRRAIGIELNPDYVELARTRLGLTPVAPGGTHA